MLEKSRQLLENMSKDVTYSGKEYSPLALAYIGDAVYEVVIRTLVINMGNAPVNRYHQETKNFVQAKSQAEFYNHIQSQFTDEEKTIFKRGRNAKSGSGSKSAGIITYKFATGLEALIGYLYINEEIDRIIELMEYGLKSIEEETNNGDNL